MKPAETEPSGRPSRGARRALGPCCSVASPPGLSGPDARLPRNPDSSRGGRRRSDRGWTGEAPRHQAPPRPRQPCVRARGPDGKDLSQLRDPGPGPPLACTPWRTDEGLHWKPGLSWFYHPQQWSTELHDRDQPPLHGERGVGLHLGDFFPDAPTDRPFHASPNSGDLQENRLLKLILAFRCEEVIEAGTLPRLENHGPLHQAADGEQGHAIGPILRRLFVVAVGISHLLADPKPLQDELLREFTLYGQADRQPMPLTLQADRRGFRKHRSPGRREPGHAVQQRGKRKLLWRG